MKIKDIPIGDIAPCPWQTRVIHEDASRRAGRQRLKPNRRQRHNDRTRFPQ